jgi:hypothetical protein
MELLNQARANPAVRARIRLNPWKKLLTPSVALKKR